VTYKEGAWFFVSLEVGQRPIVANPELDEIFQFGADEIKQSSSQGNKDKF
jgi:hypothetical protein